MAQAPNNRDSSTVSNETEKPTDTKKLVTVVSGIGASLRSIWCSLPGMFGALAVLIAAITALIIELRSDSVPLGPKYVESVRSAVGDGRLYHIESVVHHLRIERSEDGHHLRRSHRMTYSVRLLADIEPGTEGGALQESWTTRKGATDFGRWHGGGQIVQMSALKWNMRLEGSAGELVTLVTGWDTSVPVQSGSWIDESFEDTLGANQDYIAVSPNPDSAANVTLIVESDSLRLDAVANGAQLWSRDHKRLLNDKPTERNMSASGAVDSVTARWSNLGPADLVRLIFQWDG